MIVWTTQAENDQFIQELHEILSSALRLGSVQTISFIKWCHTVWCNETASQLQILWISPKPRLLSVWTIVLECACFLSVHYVFSLKHVSRWIGSNKLPVGVNEFVIVSVHNSMWRTSILSRVDFCFMPNVPGTGSGPIAYNSEPCLYSSGPDWGMR